MSMYRTKHLLLVLGALVLIGSTASAQDLETAELFKQPDTYFCLDPNYQFVGDMNPENDAPEGWFFVWDHLRWSISTPNTSEIGLPGASRTAYYGPFPYDLEDPGASPINEEVVQTNTLNTSAMEAQYTYGDRIEFGRFKEHHGWVFSTYRLKRQANRFVSSGVSMVFEDPPFGDTGNRFLEGIVGTMPSADPNGADIPIVRNLPLTFDDVLVENWAEHWSCELSYVRRTHKLHHGGYLEWYFGARYFEFNDTFNVDARGARTDTSNVVPFGTILADSLWETTSDNHIIGPQIALRWSKRNKRWHISTEGRFTAGANFQNIRQRGTLGSELTPPGVEGTPLLMAPTSFDHGANPVEFTPLVELRIDVRYGITQNIDLRAGWTGIWMDGIARASNMIDYRVPNMGIMTQYNDQDVLIHGFNCGIDINR